MLLNDVLLEAVEGSEELSSSQAEGSGVSIAVEDGWGVLIVAFHAAVRHREALYRIEAVFLDKFRWWR